MITIVYSHPYPSRSRACAALLAGLAGMEEVAVRPLYDLYPDFDIDGDAERAALEASHAVVWMGPLYWYTVPALMKHWIDHVLVKGWAYGEGGTKLAGKRCLWVATTGSEGDGYREGGVHGHAFEAFVPVVSQTARFCGMDWQEPFIVHRAHLVPEEDLEAAGARLRARLEGLRMQDWPR